MAKISETATVILTAAAARDNRRVLPLPKLKAPPVVVRKALTKMIADRFVEEIPAARDDEVWEHSENDGNTILIVATAGLAAIGMEDEEPAPRKTGRKAAKSPTRGRKARSATKAAKKTPRARTVDTDGKRETKQDKVLALLRRASGASIEEMMAATDWLPHSVRGFMSGAAKKRFKLDVVGEKDAESGERRYYIAAVATNT